jgi:hypothetical protein
VGLFEVRTLVLMLVATVIGGTIGVLTYLGGQAIPLAIVAGLLTSGASLAALHVLVKNG